MSSSHGAAEGRTISFSRNMGLETLLRDINSSLWAAELNTLANYQEAEYPLILVMGPHRSGTTLFMQWLANTGLVAYPTNLLSRFYQAPIIGAKIQLLLTDPRFNFRDELGEFVQQTEYRSENGKTKGVLAPNEFWYFWRRFLAEPGRDIWSDDELRQTMDITTLKAELAGIMDVFQKPFVAKGMLFNYNIPFLDRIFEKVIFVYVYRNPVANVASVLEARRRQLGTIEQWYSFDIPEKDELIAQAPEAQVAGQVACINRAVTNGLAGVNEHRKLEVCYEDFCKNPAQIYDALVHRLKRHDETIDTKYEGPESFSVRSNVDCLGVDEASVMAAYSKYFPR